MQQSNQYIYSRYHVGCLHLQRDLLLTCYSESTVSVYRTDNASDAASEKPGTAAAWACHGAWVGGAESGGHARLFTCACKFMSSTQQRATASARIQIHLLAVRLLVQREDYHGTF